jgi:hypothetical protein
VVGAASWLNLQNVATYQYVAEDHLFGADFNVFQRKTPAEKRNRGFARNEKPVRSTTPHGNHGAIFAA